MSKAKKAKYGVTRYAMVNAGTHQMSVFPVDQALSISGNNNLGKTQALQSMQFLFFTHMSHMNFGAFDMKVSRNFFFPSENSFLVMEVSLPTGTYMLGAYGKGPTHGNEYELFACKHKLDMDDFVEDGRIISHKRVFARWTERGVDFIPLSRDEMRMMIYGEYTKVRGGRWDMTLVPLINSCEKRYQTFRHIYRHLLTQPELKSRELKELIMMVFGDKLNNSAVNFAEVRHQAFREYNLIDNQIVRTESRRDDILNLHQETANFKEHMAAASLLKRQYAVNLAFQAREVPFLIERAKEILDGLITRKKSLDDENRQRINTRDELNGKVRTYENKQQDLKALIANTDLVSREEVEKNLNATSARLSEINRNLESLTVMNKESLERKILATKTQIKQLEARIKRLSSGEAVMDVAGIPVEDINQASRFLNQDIFSLSASSLREEVPGAFGRFVQSVLPTNDHLRADGFTLNLSDIQPTSFSRDNMESLEQDLALEHISLEKLEDQLQTACNAEEKRAEARQIQQQVTALRRALSDYDNRQECEAWLLDNAEDYKENREQLAEIKILMEGFSERLDALNVEMGEANKTLQTMEDLRKELQRHQRSRHLQANRIPFAEGADEDFLIPISEFDLGEAEDQLNRHENALNNIELKNAATRQRILDDLPDLSSCQDDLTLAEKAKERLDSLPDAREQRNRLHQKAVIDVASILSNLSEDYLTIENQIAMFNRDINKRKISNLKRFSINLHKNEAIMESIDTLIQFMKMHTQAGDLFTVDAEEITDPEVRRAMERLTKIVEQGEGGSLELADLFEVSFSCVDVNDKETIVDKIDKLGSTGTKMTMKPLLYMCLIRYLTDRKSPVEAFLPFYIDEVAGVDPSNQTTLIGYCNDMMFTPVFTSVHPTTTARYGVNVGECLTESSRIWVTEDDWQYYEPINDPVAEDQLDMIS